MPITGEFISDFDDFVRGAKTAEAELAKLEGQGQSLGTSFEGSLQKLDFEKLFNSPVKTSLALIGDVVAGIPVIGQVAIVAGVGLGILGKQLYDMASASAAVADNLGDLSDKTGLTVPELSKLSNAAYVAGTDIETMSNGIYTMLKRMDERPTEFEQGLKAINVDVQEFKNLKPAEQWQALGEALNATEDPQKRIAAGNDLLGSQYRTLGPALMDVAEAQGMVAGIKPWTEEDTATAEEMNSKVRLLKLEFAGIAEEIGRNVMPIVIVFADLLQKDFEKMRKVVEDTKHEIGYFTDFLEMIGVKSEAALPKVKAMTAETMGLGIEIKSTTMAKEQDKETTKQLAAQEAAHKKELAEAEAAEKKYAAALVEVMAAGDGWRGTLSGIDAELVAGIQRSLEAGVSQSALATVYKLTAVEIKAVASALEAEKRIAAETRDLEASLLDETVRLYNDYYGAKVAGSTDTTQKQIDHIWQVARNEETALAKRGALNAETQALILGIAQRATDNLITDELRRDKGSRDYYENIATQAEAAYSFALEHSERYTQTRIDQLRRESEAASTTLLDWRSAAEAALTDVKGAADITTEAIKETTKAFSSLGTAVDITQGKFTQQNTGMHQEERSGGQYLVSDATGAIVQQLERKFGAGGFLGWGLPGGAGTQKSIEVHMQGVLLSNDPAARAQLSEVIGRTVMDTLKGQGVKLGSQNS